MYRQACFHAGIRSNNRGSGLHFLSLASPLKTLLSFLFFIISFLILSRKIVCLLIWSLLSYPAVSHPCNNYLYCHFGICHTIIPSHPLHYPASLSFVRRFLFLPSFSLPNVRILVGCWLATGRDKTNY